MSNIRRDLARLRLELFGPGPVTINALMRVGVDVLAIAAAASTGAVLLAIMGGGQ